MTLLVIDPYLVHAYWDLDPATLPETSPAALRVYDTTGETATYFDVPVSLPARNWYIHLFTPERSYYAELGLSEESGGFTPWARSNTIHTPRAWPAAVPATPQAEPQETADTLLIEYSWPEPAPPHYETPVGQPFRAAAALPRGAPPERRLQAERPAPQTPPETAVSGNTEDHPIIPPPRVPEPLNAARILRTRLEAIYASLEWMHPPAETVAASLASEDVPGPLPAGNPNEPGDLTQRAEEHFSTGVSSKIPKPPG